jgi:hypothetical protein
LKNYGAKVIKPCDMTIASPHFCASFFDDYDTSLFCIQPTLCFGVLAHRCGSGFATFDLDAAAAVIGFESAFEHGAEWIIHRPLDNLHRSGSYRFIGKLAVKCCIQSE